MSTNVVHGVWTKPVKLKNDGGEGIYDKTFTCYQLIIQNMSANVGCD